MLIIPFFIKHDASHLTVLLVYIDDIVLAGDNINEINRVKVILDRQFRINDLGPLRYFLGLEATSSTTGIVLNQRNYTLNLLNSTSMLASKPSPTPYNVSVKLSYIDYVHFPNPT